MKPRALGLPLVSLVLALGACEQPRAKGELRDEPSVPPPAPAPTTVEPVTASVDVGPASGSKVMGKAKLTEERDGVKVIGVWTGASPGKHGVHFHEVGDCSDPKAERAGPHFEGGTSHTHGLPTSTEHHLGNLGNVDVDEHGDGHLEFLVKGATLEAGRPTSLRGRALVLHAHEDKGGADMGGERVACGVVK